MTQEEIDLLLENMQVYQSDWSYPTLDVGCPHEFVEYIGLTDTYMYCKYCDEKKGK